jgi:putative phosphoribosyl transferase
MASERQAVRIPADHVVLDADLTMPGDAAGVVIFAHGSGSSRHSVRNQEVAAAFSRAGYATVLMDLLTSAEEERDLRTRELRFDIPLLARRVRGALGWAAESTEIEALPVALFGASTGAAAALIAAADASDVVRLVISRGGRPDLAGAALARVRAPTLLIVGGRDPEVLDLNRQAATRLGGDVELVVVPGATHLFEEPGALDRVVELALDALQRQLAPRLS